MSTHIRQIAKLKTTLKNNYDITTPLFHKQKQITGFLSKTYFYKKKDS